MNTAPTVGLTGGIGSGKTTVAKRFEALGIPVYYSDDEAKKLYADPDIQKQINQIVQTDLFASGELDRAALSKILFSDPDIRARINAVIHPKVRENFARFCTRNSAAPYVMNEAAILFETGTYKTFRANVLVSAPEELRIQRIAKRDGLSREAILERIAAQWSEDQKMALADFVIHNGETDDLDRQVNAIHGELLRLRRVEE